MQGIRLRRRVDVFFDDVVHYLPLIRAHCAQKNQEPVQNNDGSRDIGLSLLRSAEKGR